MGTRPQLVKSIPIIREAIRRNYDLEIIHTGQHYDVEMSDVFFKIFSIPTPVTNLNVGSKSEGSQVGEIIIRLGKFLAANTPDIVMVPGDTNSALGAAIATAKLGIPLAHVEAGARSFNMKMQEELNRRAIDHISGSLFAVSARCRANLFDEKVLGRLILSGDTMFEIYQKSAKEVEVSDILEENGVQPLDYFVATIHRAENTRSNELLLRIIKALGSLDRKVVFPAHPRTQNVLRAHGVRLPSDNLKLTQPLDYFSMMKLLKNSLGLFTDSGGLQKEALWSKTPCVTLRNETEWMETVDLGVNSLIGTRVGNIVSIAKKLVRNREQFREKFVEGGNPYVVPRHRPSQIILDGLRSHTE